jgi:hypothetical protein
MALHLHCAVTHVVQVGLLGPDGEDLPLHLEGKGAVGTSTVLRCDDAQNTFTFTDVTVSSVAVCPLSGLVYGTCTGVLGGRIISVHSCSASGVTHPLCCVCTCPVVPVGWCLHPVFDHTSGSRSRCHRPLRCVCTHPGTHLLMGASCLVPG